MFLGITGWVLALGLAVVFLPRIYRRLIVKFPFIREEQRNRALENRKALLAASAWKDPRPLNLFAGDSQIELGDWYAFFAGEYAIRNCGLSGATIQEVTDLVTAVPDRNPASVILMCGINDLSRNNPIDRCIADYSALLKATRALQPAKVFVLSVMPVRESSLDRNSKWLNREVDSLNVRLRALCEKERVKFVDVNGVMTDGSGALGDKWTEDGLHLNAAGYRTLAECIRRHVLG